MIAAAGVFIAAINQIVTRRRTEKTEQLNLETRQAQLFAQIHAWWRTRDAVKAYGNVRYKITVDKLQRNLSFDEWVGKYGADVNPEAYADLMTLWAFFEGIGVLVKKGLIDVELVEDLFSQRFIWIWENLMQSYIDDMRKITDDPTQYDSFEYLYYVMKQHQQQ